MIRLCFAHDGCTVVMYVEYYGLVVWNCSGGNKCNGNEEENGEASGRERAGDSDRIQKDI